MLKEYRRKSAVYHGADNLRWMKKLRRPETLVTAGAVDPATLEKFQVSSLAVMEGYLASGTIERIGVGKEVWVDALRENPEDNRLGALIQKADIIEAAREQTLTSGLADDPASLANLARTRMDQKRWVEALELLDRVRELDSGNRAILFNRLLVLKALKRTPALRTELAEFRKKFPTDARGFDMSGRLAVDAQNLEEAIGLFRSASDLDPANPIYFSNLATSLVKLERFDEAAGAYAAACGIQTDFPSAGYFAAACFSMAGQTEKSAEWMAFCLENGLA